MNDEILDEYNNGNFVEMPKMINVLTILTFIYSGLITLYSAWYLLTLDKRKEELYLQMEMMKEGGKDIPFLESISELGIKAVENAPFLYSLEIIVAILCTIGAIQMRKILKQGFYIYAFASIGYIAGAVYIFGFGAGIISYVFISALFLILYGVNLKQLK